MIGHHRNARGAALAATLLAATATAAHAATWIPTATRALAVADLANATDLGRLANDQPLTVRIGLRMRNQAALLARTRAAADPASPEYGRYLTRAQFVQGYAPTEVEVDRVVNYLKNVGFTNITVEPNFLLISADGTAYQAERAFNTRLERVSMNGAVHFINIEPAEVPADIAGSVTAVLGLNSVGQMRSTLALPSAPQYLVSYTPKQFQVIYNATDAKQGAKATIAIMAEGDVTGVISDLRIAEKAFGLPKAPLTSVQVGQPSTDTSGADEWDLDTQYSSGMAGTLKMLYLYHTTSLSDSDLALEFSRWASDDLARAGSASLGECEIFPYLDGSMAVDDMIFLEASSQGQTFFASSGDTGSFCPLGPAGVNGVPAGAPLVNYPATSPYVIGVGGTTLVTNADGTYGSEVSWYAGSGGVSQFEGSPYWQSAAVAALGTSDMRGVPDIAMDADPESGALVYVNGSPEGVGGTSLSSPLALGIWARAISTNTKLGFGPPQLYGLYNPTGGTGGVVGSYPVGGFHDITVGANGIYTALPGYDLTAGLGTLIVDQLAADLAK